MATTDGRKTIQDMIDALVTRIGDTDKQITAILAELDKLDVDYAAAEKALAEADTALDGSDSSSEASAT